MTEQQATTTDDNERSKKLRKAYGNATTRLREAHRDEFDSLYSQEAESLGVEYTPRPSAEQKALQQLQALLDEYPQLRGQVAGTSDDSEGFEDDQAQRI